MITTVLILFTHFVADFIFQTEKQATKKGTSNWLLTAHVITYGIGLTIFAQLWIGNTLQTFCWVFCNMILHWITDFVTSRINSHLWKKGKENWFFVGIGADQFIHHACLLLTYEALNIQQLP
jgi:hypothetical protein